MQPFKIDIAQDVLETLQSKLKNTRWTDELPEDDWTRGMHQGYLQELVHYWQHQFNWRKQEAFLNSYPQFKTTINDISIHFIHVKGKGPSPKPLILTHEWPDSFFRFYKIILLLTDPAAFGGDASQSFDVIIPSVPGFGFSERTTITSEQTATLWGKLMAALDYQQYYAAGAYAITHALAVQYPEQVKAIHLTDTGYPNGTEDWSAMTPAEQAFGQQIQQWFFAEGAFNMLHSTKPQTLSFSLQDSPAGLASWLTEKFYAWSDNKGHVENSFTRDELLTHIMIYWVTDTITTSIRTYQAEARATYAGGGPKPTIIPAAPAGIAVFPADADFPQEWAARRVNVQRFHKMQAGGRFAASETPVLYADEIRSFFEATTKNN